MPLGYPFYILPGVYVRTKKRAASNTVPSNLRLPLLYGEGAEKVSVIDYAMIRASSNSVDNKTLNENVSARFLDSVGSLIDVDGTTRKFRVKNLPIVTGDGSGTPTSNPADLSVTINGSPAAILKVEGALGNVYLSQLPLIGDVVKVSYYYDKRDAYLQDEDLSYQVDGTVTTFKVKNPRIVDGTNGGVTATLPSQIKVKVNGITTVPTAMNGVLGTFTLATAPASNSLVLVSYYTNNYEDTADPFPEEETITDIDLVGNNPGRLDYVNTVDFVLADGEIHWGASKAVSIGVNTPGSEVFDSSKISTTLVDNRRYMETASGTSNGINKTFTVSSIPTDGTGRDRPTSNPDLIEVYVGSDIASALLTGAVVVSQLNGTSREVALRDAPISGQSVFVSYYYNMLTDADFEIVSKTAGVNPTGKYAITSTTYGDLPVLTEGTHAVADVNFTLEGIIYPNSFSDLQVIPGAAVNETVTVTFTSATEFTVTSTNALGSAGTGTIEQTYIDSRTGLRFTILDSNRPVWAVSNPYNFALGDTIEFEVAVGAEYGVAVIPNIQVPGLWILIEDTTGIAVDDSLVLKTFDKAGKEPTIGSIYYASYRFEKTDMGPYIIRTEQENEILIGEVNPDNRLSLGVRMALRNGALAVGAQQILREFGQPLGSTDSYIQAIDAQKIRLAGDVNQYFHTPLKVDLDILGFLKQHVEQQSSELYGNRRIGLFGFSLGTTPTDVIDIVKSLKSDRMWACYPDGVIAAYNDALGREIEVPVDGSFLAAALAGRLVAPVIDSATPVIGIQLVDIKRLFRKLDPVTTNQVISAGVIYFKDVGTSVECLDAYTSDPSNLLTTEPNVNLIDDELAEALQLNLRTFRGRKSLAGLESEIAESISRILDSKSSGARQIIRDYKDIVVVINPDDPREGEASVAYLPVFPFKWLRVTLNVQTRF